MTNFADLHAEAKRRAEILANSEMAAFTNPDNWDDQLIYGGSCSVQIRISEPYAKWCKSQSIGVRGRAWPRGPVVQNIRLPQGVPQHIRRQSAAAYVAVLAEHGVTARMNTSEAT